MKNSLGESSINTLYYESLANFDTSQANHRAEQDWVLSVEANEIVRSALGVSRSAKTISIEAIVAGVATAIIVAAIQFLVQRPL